MSKKDDELKGKSEQVEKKNPPEKGDDEIPQEVWDTFGEALDKILKVPKDSPNQQAG